MTRSDHRQECVGEAARFLVVHIISDGFIGSARVGTGFSSDQILIYLNTQDEHIPNKYSQEPCLRIMEMHMYFVFRSMKIHRETDDELIKGYLLV